MYEKKALYNRKIPDLQKQNKQKIGRIHTKKNLWNFIQTICQFCKSMVFLMY